MQDVVRRGTAAKVAQLGRRDLAGKTGTTNDQVDAWFAGFQPSLVAVAWIGFDQPRTLGKGETGAQAALPMWMKYMGEMLKGVPQASFTQPKGVVAVQINPLTGLPVGEGEPGTPEYFYQEAVPIASSGANDTGSTGDMPPDQVDTKAPEPGSSPI